MFKYEQVGRCYKVSCATGYCETIPSGFDTDYDNYNIYYFLDYGDEYPQGGMSCGKPKCKSGYTDVSGTSGTPDSDYFDYVSGDCNGSTTICAKCKNSGTSGTSKSFGGLTCYKPSSSDRTCTITASCSGLSSPTNSIRYSSTLTCTKPTMTNVSNSTTLSGLFVQCYVGAQCSNSPELAGKTHDAQFTTSGLTMKINDKATDIMRCPGGKPIIETVFCDVINNTGCTVTITGLP